MTLKEIVFFLWGQLSTEHRFATTKRDEQSEHLQRGRAKRYEQTVRWRGLGIKCDAQRGEEKAPGCPNFYH